MSTLLVFRRSFLHTFRMPQRLTGTVFLPPLLLWALVQLFGRLPEVTRAFPAGSYLDFIVPAVLVAGILPVAALNGAASLRGEGASLLRHTLAAPVRVVSVFGGYVLCAASFGLLGSMVVLLASTLGGFQIYSGAGVAGALAMGALACLLLFAAGTLLAMLVSNEHAFQIGMCLLIGGAAIVVDGILPRSLLPSWLNALSIANPVRYAIDGARDALARRPDWAVWGRDLEVLASATLLMLGASLLVFRRWADR